MRLNSERELANARRKLRLLEESYEDARTDMEDAHQRELELESLTRLMNQVKEEIASYEAHHAVRR